MKMYFLSQYAPSFLSLSYFNSFINHRQYQHHLINDKFIYQSSFHWYIFVQTFQYYCFNFKLLINFQIISMFNVQKQNVMTFTYYLLIIIIICHLLLNLIPYFTIAFMKSILLTLFIIVQLLNLHLQNAFYTVSVTFTISFKAVIFLHAISRVLLMLDYLMKLNFEHLFQIIHVFQPLQVFQYLFLYYSIAITHHFHYQDHNSMVFIQFLPIILIYFQIGDLLFFLMLQAIKQHKIELLQQQNEFVWVNLQQFYVLKGYLMFEDDQIYFYQNVLSLLSYY